MSKITLHDQQNYDWQQEKINELAHELAKAISFNLKEGNWYNYTLRFKKDVGGKIIIKDDVTNKEV